MDNKESVTLQVELLDEDVVHPYKYHDSDGSFIVNAHKVEEIYAHGGSNSEELLIGDRVDRKFTNSGTFVLQCNERALIGTKIKAYCPGHEIQIRSLGKLAWDNGLVVLPGTIEPEDISEILVLVINTSRKAQEIRLGFPIARITPVKISKPSISISSIDDTDRIERNLRTKEDVKITKPVNVPIMLNI